MLITFPSSPFSSLPIDLDRSSSHHANGLTAESFSPAQIVEIRQDLEVIMEAHLGVPDDSVAELLQFFNKAVNSVIAGVSCDPRTLDKMLLDRFHMTVCCVYVHGVVAFSFSVIMYVLLFFVPTRENINIIIILCVFCLAFLNIHPFLH